MKKAIAIITLLALTATAQVTVNFPASGVMPVIPRTPAAGMVLTPKYESFELCVRNAVFPDGTYGRELIPGSVRVQFFDAQGQLLSSPYWGEVSGYIQSARISRADLERTAAILGMGWPADGAVEVKITMFAFVIKLADLLQIDGEDRAVFVQTTLKRLAKKR